MLVDRVFVDNVNALKVDLSKVKQSSPPWLPQLESGG